MYQEIKKVRVVNGERFIEDFKRVRKILAYTQTTESFFIVKKSEVWNTAKNKWIRYYLSEDIFVVKQSVMVII